MDEDDILLCSKCKSRPRLFEVTGLWYLQCPGRCERLEIGITKKRAIENWNELNRKAVKYMTKKPKLIPNELDGVGEGEQIYQLNAAGKTIKTYKSCRHLANVLGTTKNSVVSKFYKSKTGYVTIKGVIYFREPKNAKDTKNTKGTNNVKATPTATRRGRPRKVQD